MPALLLNLSASNLLMLHRKRRLLISHLAARHAAMSGAEASEGEHRAWAESLIEMAAELTEVGRGEVHMLVECKPDGAPAPIDVVLAGRHPDTGRDSFTLVELKGWSTAVQSKQEPEKFEVPGLGLKPHPGDQLGRTYDFFTGDHGPLKGMQIHYAGFSYLHNAEEDAVRDLFAPGSATGPHTLCFTRETRSDLHRELLRQFDSNSGATAAETLLQRMGVRNPPLLDAMVHSRGEDTVFTLRGEQKRAADAVRMAVERTAAPPSRSLLVHPPQRDAVFIIRGGAGSGKSAIGLELMRKLSGQGHTVKYASGSRAFDASMRNHVGFRDRAFKDQFAFFSSFIDPPVPRLDLLICDEAHRLRERSTNRRLPEHRWGKGPQIDELMNAAGVTVFLLDARQSVRPKEVGSVDLVTEAARRRGIEPVIFDLQDQFRCGGSDAYRRWVHDLLGFAGRSGQPWQPDGLMHVEVADSPEDLERTILGEHRSGASARMVAGFCWPWNKPKGRIRRLVRDVRIGDWHRKWNAWGDNTCEDGAPPAKLWGVNPKGVHQIGCVYSSQGLEWDWCGVILGDDMVWRNGTWVFQRGAQRRVKQVGIWRVRKRGSFDPEVRSSKVAQDDFEECVRNAYHVLLTRGSRAVVLYSTDPQTQDYLKRKVGEVAHEGLRPTWKNLPPAARRTLPVRGSAKRVVRMRQEVLF
ncbi:DUF2075 domain-containing protein [Streptomyces sp. H34-S4]|uniref:DUF2075 domain-containing protein n=1 Tax=Streptomyces sp. H34-S4 TaxID=2996463 RepID=UPI00226ED4FE|nr:DUF2075 domain-containing protein [Streptomyces sp. H34-S4]MCY0933411.1 DUF2075 domain-containing protein [Streptomyces sp. H34-S4]